MDHLQAGRTPMKDCNRRGRRTDLFHFQFLGWGLIIIAPWTSQCSCLLWLPPHWSELQGLFHLVSLWPAAHVGHALLPAPLLLGQAENKASAGRGHREMSSEMLGLVN